MSYNAYYNYLKNKKIKDEEQKIDDSLSKNPYSPYYNYLKNINESKNDGSEDIAPVGGKKDTWFKGGGFSDGVDGVGDFFVDLGETVGGTVGDLGVGLLKGATRLVEGLGDLGIHAVGGVAGALGADGFKEYTKEVAAHNATDAIFKAPEEFFDKGSVLGDKADNVTEGLGQVGAIILTGGALGAAGASSGVVSGVTTGAMGLSSMGSGITEAYEGGASDGEAWKYGLNKGAIDAASELIFGGLGKASQALGFSKGLSSLDDIAAKKVGNVLSKIAKKEGGKQLLNNFGEFVVKSGAEGAEEVIAGYLTAHAKKGTYMSEEDFSKILEDENLLEQFIVGSLTSAVSQSGVVPGMKRGSLIETTKNGADFVTGHTKNEQTVVDKIFEKELSKEENKALSKKQKNELYESIVEDMERGQISVEEIEEILGGEDYTSYKKASDENASLKKELEELSNMKKGDMTRNQEKRLAELEGMNLDDTTKIDELRGKVSKSVLEMVENDRKGGGSLLMESYLERSRMAEDLKIDVDKYKDTKYAEAAKKTIENALNAKANNTRAVHDLVDMMAKVSSETNEVFKFGSNDSVKADYLKIQNENLAKLEAVKNKSDAQIKEIAEIKKAIADVQSGKVKVNGNISSDGIMINLDSPRALHKVVGHEVTHKLEKSEHYTKLQEALFAYAKTKGVKVNERLQELESIYKGVNGADAKAELTSDLVGEYLFGDYEFIKNLAKDRNTFQKVWDEIKHLAKLATAGSKEARELEKVKRMFEKAYQESKVETKAKQQEADAASGDVAFSLVYSQEIENKSVDYFDKHKPEHISQEMFDTANGVIQEMVDYMKPYLDITNNNGKRYLPEEIIGNTIFKNGSYGKTIENTTICYRTLAYIDFTNEIKKRIGRPLTVDESFLASQMLYDIASDPQCLYCYVSLDRKAYDGFLLEYTEQMNAVINGYNALETKDKNSIGALYKNFLGKRKDTNPMKARFNMWLDVAKNSNDIITLEDLTTEDVRAKIINDGGAKAKQIIDAERYAQSASWAKKMEQYRSYNSEILKMSPEVVKKLNSHYGLRFYSFSEYTPAFIAENMQQIRDASLRGLYGLGYTKEIDFAKVFAPTGMNINMSVFGKMQNGKVIPDTRQGADWEAVKAIRNEHENVGAVFVATSDELVDWALAQDWIDVVIPFHIVRTGASVAEFYKWTNNTKFQADKDASGKNKTISPTEHHNDLATFKRLVEERGLTPRFDKWIDNPNYMKLVNETRLSVDESSKLVPNFNLDNAKTSFDNFVGKGGYYGNWYKDGVDFDKAVDLVAQDVLEGKRANEVDYGRQDLTDEQIAELKKRKGKPRVHHQIAPTQFSLETVDNTYYVKAEKNIFTKEDGTQASEREIFNSLVGKTIPLPEGDVKIVKRLLDKDMYNELYRRYPQKLGGVEDVKQLNSDVNYNMEELLINSEMKKPNVPDYNRKHAKQGVTDFDTRTVKFYDGTGAYTIDFSIANLQDGEKVAYAKKFFGYDDELTKKIQDVESRRSKNTPFNQHPVLMEQSETTDISPINNSIPQNSEMSSDLEKIASTNSLSQADDIAPIGRNDVFGKDFRVQDAPIREDINKTVDNVAENVDNNGGKKSQIESRINELKAQGEAFVNEVNKLNEQMAKGEIVADDYQAKLKEIKSKWDEVRNEQNTLTEELTKLENTFVEIEKKPLRQLVNTLAKKLDLKKVEKLSLEKLIQDYNKGVYKNKEELLEAVKKGFDTHYYTERNEVIAEVRDYVRNTAIKVSEEVKSDVGYQAGGWGNFYRRNMGRIRLSQNGVDVDTFYQEASELYPGFFPDDITNPAYQLRKIEEVANMPKDEIRAEPLGDELMQDITDYIYDSVKEYKASETFKILNEQFYDIDSKFEQDKKALDEEYAKRRADAETLNDKEAFIKQKAKQFVDEFNTHKQGTRFSDEIGYLKDLGYGWGEIKSAFNNIRHSPNKMVNSNPGNHYYEVEMAAREVLNEAYEDAVYESTDLDAKYNEKLAELEAEANKARDDAKKGVTGTQRQRKQKIYAEECRSLIGDTSTWKDRKYGISYQTNTLQRNLREVVRDANGNRDIAKADAIYEYLQGDYNHNEAELKKESRVLKKRLADLKVNKYESEYAQMLGEFKHNPETELTQEIVDGYYKKHKDKINTVKVDEAIEYVRNTYDTLIERVNEVLREQGMKEIPYRKGYFPHFTNEKQGWLGKLLNWKTQNTEIPTDIAGMTEQFNPNRSWQSFNKKRTGDTTDYNLLKGFDQYVHGALDWIYHIEDLQKRRAFENEIRYAHSEKGIQEKIEKIKANTELDADEVQEQMDAVWKEAKNPLNNFVTDLRNGTNALAGKKSTADRELEYMTNRKIYSTMTNISNRVTANMVAGSVSSALTNFIPITQSWGMVSPVSSLKATRDLIKNVIKDDGMIEKSDFMTNRLMQEENLAKTGWDKVGEVVGGMMTIADRISTEVVWRSKYIENINNGMSENEAIHDADVFAEKVMAGRSRGNMPTIYNSKNPITKMFTAFQLEVANQYGYMFKDMPQDIGKKNIGKLAKGYATMFIGAYVYNALYSALTGRDAAFDPIGIIIEDLLKDLFPDDDEEKTDVAGAVEGLAENVAQELPFVGGLFGGGRMPISSALPDWEGFWDAMTEEDKEVANKKFISSLDGTFYYGVMPMGGGQLKKTTQGLKMFSEDIGPVSGSYTDSGNLRFPVEDTFGNRVQAAVFGQYASKNAREYFDNDFAPLKPNQIEEYAQVGMDYTEYQKYRKGLSGLKTNEEKFNYINSLDLTTEQKNVLVNNVIDRKSPVDMSDYGDYVSYEEFDYATKYPEKYLIAEVVGGYEAYKSYAEALNEIKPNYYPSGEAINGSKKQKVIRYINSLDAEQGAKMILLKMMYPSETRYDTGIRIYLKNQGLSNVEIKAILAELGI